MNYIKKITQTHRLKLWDEAFDTWEKAYFFAETICPELIEVPHFSFLFNCVISYIDICICEFNRQLCLINEEHESRIFLNIDPIKSVSLQENELKKKYRNDRLQRELELNKIFLKKLDERMDNGNPLSCVIEKFNSNELKGSIETRLKPIRHLTFSVGDFTTQESRPDHLELKQVMQKNNEFDIRGNEELVFAYGLTNNEMVLVVSIDKNVSDALSADATSDEKKKNDKQDVWNEQYNQNCVTRIFLSSRQMLNKKKATEELRGKITLAALSEQKHLMVLYERARQLIHVYKWNERITDSLQQLKDKTVRLRDQ
ncbi:hypothetical protein RFI_34246, partial [Reticulomyxa filosa]